MMGGDQAAEKKTEWIAVPSPYPGLRPFQADDFEYFFGREVQVREIVQRLKDKRFVAIVGGSGSGKSSLVLAGAIPALRSYEIEEMGDFWVPVICTPGTNHVSGDGPIRRLARKFCAELKPVSDLDSRLARCVELMTMPGGLGKLVDEFGRDLADSDGVDLDRDEVSVNFLFLIDQFEELFHPSNAKSGISVECQNLVDRIVEQFKEPHPRVCIALTMRSEHLNDCPRYPDLPDALNAASYLVKRLNDEQLREVIERPATQFLYGKIAEARMAYRRRGAPATPFDESQWPQLIQFEEVVIERLMKDLKTLLNQVDHADHLPLLQHVLFWTWNAAVKRSKGLPVAIQLEDLIAAAAPSSANEVPISGGAIGNTLVECLKNRCEEIYKKYPTREKLWEIVFRSLAFKDPNTGTYTQQRREMSPLEVKEGQEGLKEQLMPWLIPHRYLHWDTESWTLKVAHEALIRRWPRLREWTDNEDLEFQAYLRLLEDCTRWLKKDRAEAALCKDETLRGYADLTEPERWSDRKERFRRLLSMHWGHERLSVGVQFVDEFLSASIAHKKKLEDDQAEMHRRIAEGKAQREVERTRQNRMFGVAAAVLILIVLGYYVQLKTLGMYKGYAVSAQTFSVYQPQFPDFDSMQIPLRNIVASTEIQKNSGMPTFLRWIWNVPETPRKLGEVQSANALKAILQGGAWKVAGAEVGHVLEPASKECTLWGEDATFFPGNAATGQLGLIVLNISEKASAYGEFTALSIGTLNEKEKVCESQKDSRPIVMPSTNGIAIASDLSNIFVESLEVSEGENGVDKSIYSLSIYALLWDKSSPTPSYRRAVVSDARRKTVLEGRIVGVKSRPGPFSSDVFWDGKWLRLFDVEPTPISDEDVNMLSSLEVAKEDSECLKIAPNRMPNTEIYELASAYMWGPTVCLHVAKDETRQKFFAKLYLVRGKITEDNANNQTPLLELDIGRDKANEFRVNLDAGWLAFKRYGEGWKSVLWSRDAWRGAAKAVFKAPSESELADLKNQYDFAYAQAGGTPEELFTDLRSYQAQKLPVVFPKKDLSKSDSSNAGVTSPN